ncbi:MAG: ShlB/FhaC/HecB family hemolysin secretion/activation protein [Cyanobacteria bacterium P01_C01_bin.72]
MAQFLICWGFLAATDAAAHHSATTAQQTQTPSPNPKNIPGTIVLKRFEIIGNRVIPESEIDSLLEPYLLRPISFIELFEVQQVITQLFVERGYLTSGAYIPPQKIQDSTVRVEIIEGSLEEIKIYGLKHLRPGYIRGRLAAATQPPLNRQKLLNALQLLQLNPRIADISAELSQGINPGQSLLEVEVEEANSFDAELTLNNYQAVSVGSQGRILSIVDHNLFGFGDRLAATYINTPSSDSLADLNYSIPLSARDNQLQIAYNHSNSLIVSEPFQDLELSSISTYLQATYRQPLLQTPQQEFTLGFALSHQDTQLFLMGQGFPTLARGTDIEGVTKISALRLIQEYSDRSSNHVFAFSSQFSLGVDLFDATVNSGDIPDSKFFIWRGQGQYIRQLTSSTNLFLRSELQFADRSLVSLEQFRAGGVASVRGYRRDRTLGDNGLFLSSELRNTLWSSSQGNLSLALNPFVDFSHVWNNDDVSPEVDTLASVGLGVQLLLGETLTANFDWGIPLIEDTGFQEDSLQDSGLYFSIKVSPF